MSKFNDSQYWTAANCTVYGEDATWGGCTNLRLFGEFLYFETLGKIEPPHHTPVHEANVNINADGLVAKLIHASRIRYVNL
jgi:hypothetical protein